MLTMLGWFDATPFRCRKRLGLRTLWSRRGRAAGARPYDDAGLGLSGIGELQRRGPQRFSEFIGNSGPIMANVCIYKACICLGVP